MVVRWLVLVLAGCGRINFDPSATTTDGNTDGPTGDAPANAITRTFGDRADADVRTGFDTYVTIGDPTFNYGVTTELQIDGGGGSTDSVLMRFVIDSIPTTASVFSASLALTCTDDGPDAVVNAFRILEPWDEGTGDNQAGAASWNERTAGNDWSAAGVDGAARDTTVAADVSGVFVTNQRISIDLLPSAVQAWVDDPNSNFGLVFVQVVGGNGSGFSSREAAEVNRPLLTVTFVP